MKKKFEVDIDTPVFFNFLQDFCMNKISCRKKLSYEVPTVCLWWMMDNNCCPKQEGILLRYTNCYYDRGGRKGGGRGGEG